MFGAMLRSEASSIATVFNFNRQELLGLALYFLRFSSAKYGSARSGSDMASFI
jgi:hypothetical protein